MTVSQKMNCWGMLENAIIFRMKMKYNAVMSCASSIIMRSNENFFLKILGFFKISVMTSSVKQIMLKYFTRKNDMCELP